jgi:hypothetical protein
MRSEPLDHSPSLGNPPSTGRAQAGTTIRRSSWYSTGPAMCGSLDRWGDSVSGHVVLDEIVSPGRPRAHLVQQGEILRIVDLEGRQAVDFLCYNAADSGDRYSATRRAGCACRVVELPANAQPVQWLQSDPDPCCDLPAFLSRARITDIATTDGGGWPSQNLEQSAMGCFKVVRVHP